MFEIGDLVRFKKEGVVTTSRLETPLLVSGPSAESCVSFLNQFGYNASLCGPEVGQASALKMTRSIMIKGVEALSAECFLTAQRLGIQPEIVASLTKSFDGLDSPCLTRQAPDEQTALSSGTGCGSWRNPPWPSQPDPQRLSRFLLPLLTFLSQGGQDSNLQLAVLETAALPIELPP